MKKHGATWIGCLCALGCEILFGFSYLFTRDAAASASPFALLGWRFPVAFAAIGICTASGLMKISLRGKALKPLLAIALCSPVLYFIGETFGIGATTVSESGAFLACIPIASVLASTVFLKERPTRAQLAGIFITLTGVLITVFAVSGSTSFSPFGYAMLCIAVVSYALYSVFTEKAAGYTGTEITFVMLAAGAVVFPLCAVTEAALHGTLPALLSLPFTDAGFRTAVLYQGAGCSVFAFFLSNEAIARIGVNRTSSFIGVSAAVSIIAGVLILKEPFTLPQLIGATVILAGVYTANLRVSPKE